jgi:hypothetical protein
MISFLSAGTQPTVRAEPFDFAHGRLVEVQVLRAASTGSARTVKITF